MKLKRITILSSVATLSILFGVTLSSEVNAHFGSRTQPYFSNKLSQSSIDHSKHSHTGWEKFVIFIGGTLDESKCNTQGID